MQIEKTFGELTAFELMNPDTRIIVDGMFEVSNRKDDLQTVEPYIDGNGMLCPIYDAWLEKEATINIPFDNAVTVEYFGDTYLTLEEHLEVICREEAGSV